MKKIKNIIFDLGGVIMNLDVPRTIKAFDEIGINNIVNDTGHNYQHSFFYDFEVGHISEDIFLQSLSNLSNQSNSYLEIKQAWNEMILDIPENRIDFIKSLKESYNLFLLSNTNSIHQIKYLNDFEDKYKYSFNNLFQKVYYSHEIGIRKPDEKVFQFILEDSRLIPEETIFVDDSLENINSADKFDINTFHIKNYNIKSIL
jgi:putative hydrolase of the HAD superfamily